jgi:hypothetical protein
MKTNDQTLKNIKRDEDMSKEKERTYLHEGMNASYLDDVGVNFVILTNVVLRNHRLGPTTSQGSIAWQCRRLLHGPAGHWFGRDLDHLDGVGASFGTDGFWTGGGGGRLFSSVALLDDDSAFLFFPITNGASSCWLAIIFLSFSLLSLAVAIPTKHKERTIRQESSDLTNNIVDQDTHSFD